ncbi:MAG: hypothetical protein KJZ77_19100 [Anaerolineales bacterium]|nr:hypothetical protein [Anaerolineales bacterium]
MVQEVRIHAKIKQMVYFSMCRLKSDILVRCCNKSDQILNILELFDELYEEETMIKIFKTILVLPVFLLHVSLVGMQLVQRVVEEKVPAISVAASLDFCWENEVVGQVPIEIVKAVSPVLKAKLEGPFDVDRYKTLFNSHEFSKETIEFFAQILLCAYNQQKYDGQVRLQSVLSQVIHQPHVILELIRKLNR